MTGEPADAGPGCCGGAARPDALDRPAGPVPAAEAAGRGRPPSSRWPGWPSTCRCRTWTGRSTTWCTAEQAESAQPGCRVRVRFAGRLVDGFVLERADTSEHQGRLAPLHKVVSPEPVLSPEVARLAREVADHYAGSMADVLRLAVPPRHARTEAKEHAPSPGRPPRPEAGTWEPLPARAARCSTRSTTGRRPARRLDRAARPDLAGRDRRARRRPRSSAGRGALVVVPDGRDVDRVAAALTARGREAPHVVLTADAGPSARYGRWLAVRRGATHGWSSGPGRRCSRRCATSAWPSSGTTGTTCTTSRARRTRTCAPCSRCGPAWRARRWWSAGSPARRRRPRWSGPAGPRTSRPPATPSAGWRRPCAASRRGRPARPGRPGGPAADPRLADRRPGARGRARSWSRCRGRATCPGLACATCRAPARCAGLRRPARLPGPPGPPRPAGGAASPPRPGPARSAAAPGCGRPSVGSGRTAEELGRAFPRTPVRTSSARRRAGRASDRSPPWSSRRPGAEPVADGRLRRGAAARRLGAAAPARPAGRRGGAAPVGRRRRAGPARPRRRPGRRASPSRPAPAVQALVRWDPVTFADRELADRAALRLPPEALMVSLTGEPAAVQALLAASATCRTAPTCWARCRRPSPGRRGCWSARRAAPGRQVVAALRAGAGVRSAHKDAGSVRIQVDPREVA